MMMDVRRRAAVLAVNVLVLLTLGGCVGSTIAPQQDRSVAVSTPVKVGIEAKTPAKSVEQVAVPVIRSQAARPDIPPAAKAVQRKAMRQLSDGDLDAAIVSAERGLRIARNSPDLLWILARAYELKNQSDQALAFAQQGLRYSSGRESKKFERILVRASQ